MHRHLISIEKMRVFQEKAKIIPSVLATSAAQWSCSDTKKARDALHQTGNVLSARSSICPL